MQASQCAATNASDRVAEEEGIQAAGGDFAPLGSSASVSPALVVDRLHDVKLAPIQLSQLAELLDQPISTASTMFVQHWKSESSFPAKRARGDFLVEVRAPLGLVQNARSRLEESLRLGSQMSSYDVFQLLSLCPMPVLCCEFLVDTLWILVDCCCSLQLIVPIICWPFLLVVHSCGHECG